MPGPASAEAEVEVAVHTTKRLHPANLPATPQTLPLSILDATVLTFAPTETVLFYDAPPAGTGSPTPTAFESGLRRTLEAYVPWTGRLRMSSTDPAAGTHDHTRRYGRLELFYGGDPAASPGVEFSAAASPARLAELVPDGVARAGRYKSWDATRFSGRAFVPGTRLSQDDLEDPSLPNMAARVTALACGGCAVGIRLSHPLADAHCLARFAQQWAAAVREVSGGDQAQRSEVEAEKPTFEPWRLDGAAAGLIDAETADAVIVARARALPMERYDYWESRPATIPAALRDLPHDEPGLRFPADEWDRQAPVLHYVLHFADDELTRLWNDACTAETRVSRQDALLAHVWSAVNRARGLTDDDGKVHLNYTLGVRARTNPPLGDAFVGSPLINADISCTGREVSVMGLPTNAKRIRETVAMFDATAISTHLHDKAHEQCPQRLWQAFLGRRHLLTTSWIHTRIYDVDFVGGNRPRYVDAIMPKIDGLCQIMEATPVGPESEKKHWARDGVDVQLYLEAQAMERLLADPIFRKYEKE